MSDPQIEDVEFLVIGGGKAGKSLAMDRAKAGWSVVMVERARSAAPASASLAFRRNRWSKRPAVCWRCATQRASESSSTATRRFRSTCFGPTRSRSSTRWCRPIGTSSRPPAWPSPSGAPSRWTSGFGPRPITRGRPATSPEAHSSRTPRGTTSGSCGRCSTAGTPRPPTASSPTPCSRRPNSPVSGLTETEARERGHAVRVAAIPAAAIPRAKTAHDTTGVWKAVVDADSDTILGVALFGNASGEVMTAVQMAMLGGLRYQQVRDAVIAHPTVAEGLNLLFDAL